MTKRALLIGCNYPGTKAELHGCVNDVNRMYKSLVQRFGFDQENITVMIDTDKRSVQPTGVNIKTVLGRLVDESEPGDVLFLHYSGHGTQVPAESGDDEDDGLDEAIVPTDLNLMTDDDFRVILKKLRHGVSFTFISDSCHSGGLLDQEKVQIGSDADSARSFQAAAPVQTRDYGARSYGDQYQHHAHVGHGRRDEEEYESRGERHGGRREEYDGRRYGEEYESRGERYGGRSDGYEGRRYEEEQEFSGDRYGGQSQGHAPYKDKSLSIQTLAEMLSEQIGHDVKPGNIRTSLFDVFGEDSSPTVKVFVSLISNRLSGMNNSEGEQHHGVWGTIGGLAMDFLKAKLDDNSSTYVESAQVSTAAVSQSGHAGMKPARSQRLSDDVGTLVSGCQSNETSADANPTGNPAQAYGALSNGIQTILGQTRGPITNGQLVTQVRELLQKSGFKQHPCLYCSDDNVDSIFICE